MARPPRAAVVGSLYHVLNRANARDPLFATPEDSDAFLEVVAEAQIVQPITWSGSPCVPAWRSA